MTNAGLFTFRDNQICLLVVPTITESELKRRRIALGEELLQSRLMMLFEQINRAKVSTE
jgi:hypothetical protein